MFIVVVGSDRFEREGCRVIGRTGVSCVCYGDAQAATYVDARIGHGVRVGLQQLKISSIGIGDPSCESGSQYQLKINDIMSNILDLYIKLYRNHYGNALHC